MFEEWAAVLGGILEVAGVPGFLESQSSIYESADADTNGWRAFVERWWGTYATEVVGVKELWPLIDQPDPIDIGLGKGDERALKTALGRRLQGLRDRQFGRLRVVAVRKRQHAQLWRLENATGPGATGPGLEGHEESHAGPPAAARELGEPSELRELGRPGMQSAVGTPPAEPGEHHVHPDPNSAHLPGDEHPAVTPTPPLAGSPSDDVTGGLAVTSVAVGARTDVGGTEGSSIASVPFMVTHAMERELRGLGYPQSVIDAMKPEEAVDILDARRECDLAYIIPALGSPTSGGNPGGRA